MRKLKHEGITEFVNGHIKSQIWDLKSDLSHTGTQVPKRFIENCKNNNNHTNINVVANIGQHAVSFVYFLKYSISFNSYNFLGRRLSTCYLSFTNEKAKTCSYHIGNQLTYLEA